MLLFLTISFSFFLFYLFIYSFICTGASGFAERYLIGWSSSVLKINFWVWSSAGACSRVKIYWSISKTTDHSYHFQIFSYRSTGSIACFSLFGNSLQNSQNILFSFPSNINHLYLSSWNKHVFGLEQVTQMLC